MAAGVRCQCVCVQLLSAMLAIPSSYAAAWAGADDNSVCAGAN